MRMLTHVLRPDTQAILLLCAGFGQSRQVEPKPLSLGEYNVLAQRLQQEGRRPANLLSPEGKDWVLAAVNGGLDPQRVVRLLERGAMLAVSVEGWTNKGLWVLGRGDEAYPQRLKRKLRQSAPPILYGVGDQALLSGGGLAIVGSRNVDEEGLGYTQRVAEKCAEQGIQVVSGGARGVDVTAMLAAIAAGGKSVGVLADSLARAAVSKKYRDAIRAGQLTLVSPYDPDARFNTGNAMNRNKHIYALADQAVIVSAADHKGGTWAGAREELKRENRRPVWVRVQGEVPEGNHQLVRLGAKSFPLEPWNRPLLSLLQESDRLQEAEPPLQLEKQLEVDVAVQTAAQVREVNGQASDRPLVSAAGTERRLPKDAYEAVLPLLLYHLQELKQERQVAEQLDVKPTQARDWLRRAVEEGRIQRTRRGYVASEEGDLQASQS